MVDYIIVGAGAAGLIAAKELSAAGKKVMVLEARNRIGGRAFTQTDDAFSFAVEGGAEFVHGNLPLTLRLLQEAGINYTKTGGEFLRIKNGKISDEEVFDDYGLLIKKLKKLKTDTSIGHFLDAHFNEEKYKSLRQSVRSYIEGYYAGTVNRVSAFAFLDELENGDEEQYRIKGGYIQLLQYLFDHCVKNGCDFQFSKPATKVVWESGRVSVSTKDDAAFSAAKVLLTVPLGVLQNNTSEAAIHFTPAIPDKLKTFADLGFGGVIKILIQFDEPFWMENKDLKKMSFLFSEEEILTWWTQFPESKPLLTGWCAGPKSYVLQGASNEELFEKSVQSLSHIFSLTKEAVKEKIIAWRVFNWVSDPYTKGGYTYITVETKEALKEAMQPIENTIYFAGEALHEGKDVGTVEAALQSGFHTAHAMLNS